MRKGTQLVRRLLAVSAAAALALSAIVMAPGAVAVAAPLPTPAPIEQPSASTATADALPTVQIDKGVVWSQVVVGNIVYAGGSFANVRPAGAAAGTNLTPRGNLLAYSITTGALVTSFAPNLNGQVKVVRASPDGSRIYVGGTFTTADGQSRFNLAAYSTATGQLVSTFKAAVGGSYVNAIAVTGSTVYVAGLIGAGNGVTRKNFAAFDTAGKLLGWAPTSDLQPDAMVLTPSKDKLIVGGRFSTINGVSQRGLVALSLTDGSILPWAAPNTIKNGWNTAPYVGKAGIFSLSADANAVYGTGWVYATAAVGNLEGSFSANPDTGVLNWVEDCHGDTYDAYSDGTNVYAVSHNHDCVTVGSYPQANPAPGNLRHANAFTAAVKGTLSRSPSTGTTYKDWSGTPAPAAINWFPDFVTGSFTGQGQAGWTVEGNGNYVVVGGEFPYVNGTLQQGLVRFARPSVSAGKSGPRLSGTKWVPTAVSLASGKARVTISQNWDRDDLNLTYEFARFGTTGPVYTTTAVSKFWDLEPLTFNDTGRTPGATYTYQVTAIDSAGNRSKSNTVAVTISSTSVPPYSQGVIDDGASLYWRLGGSPSVAAIDWAGSHNGTVGTGVSSASTGAIANDSGKGSTFNGTDQGLIATGTPVPVGTAFSVELAVKTTSTTGGKLIGYGDQPSGLSGSYDRHVYMRNDGRLVFGLYPGGVRTVTSSAAYNDGAWHYIVATMGSDGMALWVDGLKVGSDASVTSAQDYSGYWRVGGDNLGSWPGQPSNNYFTGDIDEVAVYPAALTKAQIRSHYQLAGGTISGPVAGFTSSVSGLTVAFTSTSTASDGATLSYAWTFGDGGTATSASPTHTYAAGGDESVKLVVTDSLSGTDSVTHTVKPVVPVSNVIASDDFGRTAANGWGTADVGGAWSTSAGTSVSDGAGQLVLLTKGQTRNIYLSSVSSTDVDAAVTVALDKVADGGGAHFNYLVRSTSAGDYRAKLRYSSAGVVTVSIGKYVGTTETLLSNKVLPGVTYAATDKLNVRFQAITTGSTTALKVKVWKSGTAEPSAWFLSSSDGQQELQGPGRVGISAYITSTATNAPLTYSIDNLRVTKP